MFDLLEFVGRRQSFSPGLRLFLCLCIFELQLIRLHEQILLIVVCFFVLHNVDLALVAAVAFQAHLEGLLRVRRIFKLPHDLVEGVSFSVLAIFVLLIYSLLARIFLVFLAARVKYIHQVLHVLQHGQRHLDRLTINIVRVQLYNALCLIHVFINYAEILSCLFLTAILTNYIRVYRCVEAGVSLCLLLSCCSLFVIVFSRSILVEEPFNDVIDSVATVREHLRCEERELVASGVVCALRWHLRNELNQLRESLLAREAINITKFSVIKMV